MDHKHVDSKYPCPQCDFVANTKFNLHVHKKKIHLGIRYQCDHCDYSNAEKKAVEIHTIGKHTNIKFCCPHCPYSTRWVADLTKHSKGQGTCGGPCGPLPPNPGKSCRVEPESNSQGAPTHLY